MLAILHRARFAARGLCAASLLVVFWAFLGTIDGPLAKVEPKCGHSLLQPAQIADSEHAGSLGMWIEVDYRDPPPVHSAFLLFDFKQNLSRWPNVAGDISRSPPFLVAT
jgi:hypothetical protein